jgi:hypothetical protein
MLGVGIFCWLMLSFATAAYAAERRRDARAWLALAVVISPPVCLALIAITSRELGPPPAPRPAPDPRPFRAAIKIDRLQRVTRPCPHCGKLVHPQAVACRHCSTKLPRLAA